MGESVDFKKVKSYRKQPTKTSGGGFTPRNGRDSDNFPSVFKKMSPEKKK